MRPGIIGGPHIPDAAMRATALVFCVALSTAACAGMASKEVASPAKAPSAIAPIEVPAISRPAGETAAWWYRAGAARAAENGAMSGRARNVILFLGDGMSLPTVAAAHILAGQQAGQPGFLPETSAELASAALVQRLENVVSQASPGNRSCRIDNRSPLADNSRRDKYARVVVQVRLRCGTSETAAVLHSLESGSPRLFVGNLNLLSARGYFVPGTGRPSSDGGVDVSFDLYGYLRPSPAAAPPAAKNDVNMPGAANAP